MTYDFSDLSEPKFRPQDPALRPKMVPKGKEPIDTPWDAVDPAEFFDPEEFGYRRWNGQPLLT